MTQQQEEEKEIRGQRHDFLKEYYKMATADLDRHLKGGWQTIAVLAGGAAILAAGHDDRIGAPIAVAIALSTAIWGMLTVIDSNYWSLRAIGFLANVEAVYFSVEDRQAFNMYAGRHPPYRLLNSLEYLFWLCGVFGALSLAELAWMAFKDPLPAAWNLSGVGIICFLLWSLPFLVLFGGLCWISHVWLRRLVNYQEFVTNSPGPGIRLHTRELRHVTLDTPTGSTAPAIETNTQAYTLGELSKKITQARKYVGVSDFVLILVIGLVVSGIPLAAA